MTQKAEQFKRANDLFPVVEGAVRGQGGQGGTYKLANGRTFDLSRDDCLALQPPYPKWDFGGLPD